jgi:hypothetical protein
MRQTYMKKGEGPRTICRPLRIVNENTYEFEILSGNGNIFFFKKTACSKSKMKDSRFTCVRQKTHPPLLSFYTAVLFL